MAAPARSAGKERCVFACGTSERFDAGFHCPLLKLKKDIEQFSHISIYER
jgi:hypothetical protein